METSKTVYIEKNGSLYATFIDRDRKMFRAFVRKNTRSGSWKPCRITGCEWRSSMDQAQADLQSIAGRKGLIEIHWRPSEFEKARYREEA